MIRPVPKPGCVRQGSWARHPDLSEVAAKPINRDLVRSLAVIKRWESKQGILNYAQFAAQIEGGKDLRDLENLLRKDQRPDLKAMITRRWTASVSWGR
jgi:hypothetical protein